MKCCRYPFERVTVEVNGNVSFCCPAYNNDYFIGNIFKDSFEDMWFGEKAQQFRESILDGSYKYCNLDICGEVDNLCDSKNLKVIYPKIVNLSYIHTCNVRCITCRDKLDVKEDTAFFDQFIDKFLSMCRNVEVVYLNGGGDIFVSQHFKKLVNLLIGMRPSVKFILHTNGLLCDKNHLIDFGFDGRIKNVFVSIHAASKTMYEKIVRGGHWEQLQKNLEYLSELKKQNEIRNLYFMFVFHSLNYKEMPAFVKMAKKYGAEAHFWRFRNWETSEMCNNYEKYTCWDPKHKDYKKFLEVLNKLKRMDNYILDEDYLKEIQAKIKDPWWMRLKNRVWR